MRILINLSVLKAGGGLQVAHSFLEELKVIDRDDSYCVFISYNLSALIDKASFSEKFSFYLLDLSFSNFKRFSYVRKQFKKIEFSFKPDIIFTLFGPAYWRPKSFHICGFALGHFIYEDSPFFKLISKWERLRWKLLGIFKLNCLKRESDYFITETNDASQRLARVLDVETSKIFTVSNVYNGVFDEQDKWVDVSNKLSSAKGYRLITISAFYPHKNLSIIPKVIDYLCLNFPNFKFTFILTIDRDQLPNLSDIQKEHILFLGKVSIQECPLLYRNSDALFMPTLLETFSASYLEAMKMGTPIITSNLPFAVDLCKEAALYFNPLDAKDIAENIYKLAQDDNLSRQLVSTGLLRLIKFGSARSRAQKYLSIIDEVLKLNFNKDAN